ncbi:alkaline phosphatase family protein [Chondromyces apiculatus]|uniref:Metalloenzyme domain-containing protein n=1 Tax=Chondromyces apiculatus DSM 436 TaxID=1192034 RepID=A0A017SZF4_9BACT|nr:alkaline phosphatase family protein [Chondromyces apiculatus]EYF02127.1 Hypothetical protein CAP_7467 [Chondromyces apiculatus DSM 436]
MGVMAGVVIVSTVGFVSSRAPARPSEDLGRRPASTPLRADAPSVVLITLDGVRWQEIFRGVDPKLAKRARLPEASVQKAEDLLPSMRGLFFEGGTVLGDPSRAGGISASGPRFISMPAYLELLTGSASDCKDNGCTPRLSQSLTDDVGGLPSVTRREDVAVFTSWEKLSLPAALPATSPGAAPAGVFVSAGRPADDATPPFPGVERYRPDHATAAAAIGHLVKHQPRFLWVGLGDTDEWAHRGDYRGYLDALRFADRFIGEVVQHLAEMGEYGEKTMVFVTTDHGRDKEFDDHGGPASAGVWFMARGGGLPAHGVIGTQMQRHLRDVAPTVRSLLGLPARQCAGCGEVMLELLPDGA